MTPEFREQLLALPGATTLENRRDGLWMIAPEVDVTAMAKLLRQVEGRLSTITGLIRQRGETDLIYHYIVGSEALNVEARTRDNTIASIAPVTAAANWIECEIHDLFGVNFQGHPHLARLVRPVQLPVGFFREE
jgi:NADH:ubiquinone oxidoreductase subunit C